MQISARHLLCGGVLASLLIVSVTTSVAAPTKITTVEGITEFRYDNGLQVLLCPDPSKPTITVNATYLVGSRHEGYGETGMAHLLEHMLFKGTPTHPDIWKTLQDHGARFNGSTWFDRTNYFETLPASDENLEFALALESDRMVNSTILAEDLASEFSVVRNEFEIGENDPIGVLSERVMSTAYLWHNYGKSTIGSREDIERVPVDRLRNFYEKFYQPDNCVLIVAGKFEPETALRLIDRTFGALPRPERKLHPTYTWEPTQDGEREVVLRRAGDVQALDVVYHVSSGTHADYPAVAMLANILSTDQTGRLYQALVEPGLATDVSASALALHDPGVLEITVEVGLDQDLEATQDRLLAVLDALPSTEFTEAEVDRAKNASARRFESLVNDSSRIGIRLSESAALGDWRMMFFNRDRIAEVTPADVQRVAQRYLKSSNRTVGAFYPEKDPDRAVVPQNPNLAELLADYRGGKVVVAGDTFEATYEAIEAQTLREDLGFGMKLAMLPKQTRNDRVNLRLHFRYGDEVTLSGRATAASLAARMLTRGSQHHTRREIQDRFDELKAQVNIGGGGRRGGGVSPGLLPVSIECSRENLPAVLELVAEVLREPAFPADEFEKLVKESRTRVESQRSEPMSIAMKEMQRHLAPYPESDVRYVPTFDEQIARLDACTRDDVQSLYSTMMGATHAAAAAVGDFDPDELRGMLIEHFGDWKSPSQYARVGREYRAVEPEDLIFETPDKANALFAMGMNIELGDDDADYPAVFLANYILGGSPSSRFMTRIRQKEGLSYGCGTMVQASAYERSGAFFGFGMCAPENATKAMNAGREEIERLLSEGVGDQELIDAKSGYQQQLEVQLSNDSSVANLLATSLDADRTLAVEAARVAAIASLSADDVTDALRRYVDPRRLILVRAGDFAKTAGPDSR